jgi:uncharacterized protein YndB with AHSA1/START domain
MTKQKTFKRRVRSRMEKTGERYTAARRVLTPAEPAEPAESAESGESQATETATGRTNAEWFALLDEWGAAERTHAEIARWLAKQPGVSSWWSQSLTVAYEQARGRRVRHQRPDGFTITASKTVAVPVSDLFTAFVDEAHREQWLPGAKLTVRTATASRSARYDWEDGATRVNVGFTAKSDTSSTIALSHQRLPDADTAEEMKRWWRERLAKLKELLEAPARK